MALCTWPLTKESNRQLSKVRECFLRWCTGRPSSRWKTLFILILVSITIYLAIYVIPGACSGFNKPCYLPKQDLDALRKLAKAVISTLEEIDETYWLDCGTLLGAYRNGDILRYDYDIDISRVRYKKAYKEKEFGRHFRNILRRKYNITGNTMIAEYKSKGRSYLCDMQRFKLRHNLITNQTRLVESVHRITKAWSNKWKVTSFPKDLILPTARMQFLGMKVQVPRKYEELLKLRYPYTWGFTFPYKWRCWLPWNLIQHWIQFG